MPWPLSQDYNEAIQRPEHCFADPELQRGQVVTTPLGLPLPCTGNSADVYAVVSGARKWAVKCFTRQIPSLQERYQQISLHLAQVKLPFMLDFTFLQQGIRLGRTWYPVLKMQWAEGLPLNQFVKSNLDRPETLDRLCRLWVKLAHDLREADVAHCDLQHGNVLLVSGSKPGSVTVKLVDYDGMCVPSLTLLKPIEFGHPAYQHPRRQGEGIYNLEVDRFSHLVIYTALRALLLDKRLWDQFDDGENLLFGRADYLAPTRSRLFYQLLRSPSGEIRNLVEAILQALAGPLEQVPLLEALVSLPPASTFDASGEVKAVSAPLGGATARAQRDVPPPVSSPSSPALPVPAAASSNEEESPEETESSLNGQSLFRPGLLSMTSVIAILVCLVLIIYAGYRMRTIANETDSLEKARAQLREAQTEVDRKLALANEKFQAAEEAPRRAALSVKQAEEERTQAKAKYADAEALLKQNATALERLRNQETLLKKLELEANDASARAAAAKRDADQVHEAAKKKQEQEDLKQKDAEAAQAEVAKRKQDADAAVQHAADKEKETLAALQKIQEMLKSFKAALQSSKAEVREAAAQVLAKAEGPLLAPRAAYDLCDALVREKDSKVRDVLLNSFQAVRPDLAEPVKTLYLDFDTAEHGTQMAALLKIKSQGRDGLCAAPAVQWYLERLLSKFAGTREVNASRARAEQTMEVLAVISPADPATAEVLCQALKTTLPFPYDHSHLTYYRSCMRALTRVYEKNPHSRSSVVLALKGFLRHPQPKVAAHAAGVLSELDPLPRSVLPYVEETQNLVTVPEVAQAMAQLANKLKQVREDGEP